MHYVKGGLLIFVGVIAVTAIGNRVSVLRKLMGTDPTPAAPPSAAASS